MRRLLLLIAMLAGVVSVATPAWAEPPTHVMNVTKNITQTVPPLEQCPAGASVDLVFTESFHLIFTGIPPAFTSFHVSDTLTGTFTTRGPSGEVLSTGHFVARTSNQGPGFPTQAFTSVIIAVGTASDGSHNVVHILEHLTVTPAGEPVVAFERVDC